MPLKDLMWYALKPVEKPNNIPNDEYSKSDSNDVSCPINRKAFLN